MTNAEGQYELPHREPGAAGDRLRAVAWIHALADWFVEHPEVPAPEDVHATFRVDTVGDLAVHAHNLNVEPYSDGRQLSITVAGSPRAEDGHTWVQVYGCVRQSDRPL